MRELVLARDLLNDPLGALPAVLAPLLALNAPLRLVRPLALGPYGLVDQALLDVASTALPGVAAPLALLYPDPSFALLEALSVRYLSPPALHAALVPLDGAFAHVIFSLVVPAGVLTAPSADTARAAAALAPALSQRCGGARGLRTAARLWVDTLVHGALCGARASAGARLAGAPAWRERALLLHLATGT